MISKIKRIWIFYEQKLDYIFMQLLKNRKKVLKKNQSALEKKIAKLEQNLEIIPQKS